MDFNIINILYMFFRLAPFIIVSYFTLQSIFNQDLKGVIYLIGIQELGKFDKKFKKDEKVNLMHIAICKLLEPYGYYKFEFVDEDGWPHYGLNSKLPKLKPGEQSILMKESIISYFLKKGFIN